MNKEKLTNIIKNVCYPDRETTFGIISIVATLTTVTLIGKLVLNSQYHKNRERTLKNLVKSYRKKNRELIDKLDKVEGCLFEE